MLVSMVRGHFNENTGRSIFVSWREVRWCMLAPVANSTICLCMKAMNYAVCALHALINYQTDRDRKPYNVQAKGTTPRGLRINIRCHAFLKRESNVEQEFQETTRCAEADYVQFGCWV
jgi:hypothetical protein